MNGLVLEPNALNLGIGENHNTSGDSLIDKMNSLFDVMRDDRSIGLVWNEYYEALFWQNGFYDHRSSMAYEYAFNDVLKVLSKGDPTIIFQNDNHETDIEKCEVLPEELYSEDEAEGLKNAIAYAVIKNNRVPYIFVVGHETTQRKYASKNMPETAIEMVTDGNSLSETLNLCARDNIGGIIHSKWPQKAKEIELLREIVDEYLRIYQIDPLYQYSFGEGFIKSLLDWEEFADRIVEKIAQRLSNTIGFSSPGFRDEIVKGKNTGLRRLRVTEKPTSTRLHYVYRDSIIEFLDFSGPGEHDKVLKKK